MTFILSALLALLALEATATGVVKHPLHRRSGIKHSLHTRSTAAVDRPLNFHTDWLDQGGYFIAVDVGTPPQTFEVLVDTGSSDFFIPAANAANCKKGNCPGGSFTPDDSSSYSLAPGAPSVFESSFLDGSHVVGKYGDDTVRVGSAALRPFVFGVADRIQVSPSYVDGQGNPIGAQYGIMGVNFVSEETALDNGYNFTSPTVPLALKKQGYIGSQSYSLYLDDIEADNGHMIFGGIDTAKFTGELATLGVAAARTNGEQLIAGTGFAVKWKGKTTQLRNVPTYTANLDSGTTGWDIPQSAFNQILDAWSDLHYNSLPVANRTGNTLVPCTYINEDASITLQLAGTNNVTASIDVPLGNMLVPALTYETTGNYNDTAPLVLNGTEQCIFTPGGSPDNGTEFYVGDPFFRSAYAFFNLDEQTVSLAQASYNVNETNIVPVGAGNISSTYPSGSGGKEPFPSYTPTAGSSPVPYQPVTGSASALRGAGLMGAMLIAAASFL